MNRLLTPEQAAKKAGVSRSTISRALKDMRLMGVRGNNNRWSITQEALDEWMGSGVQIRPNEQPSAQSEQIRDLLVTVSVQSTQITMLKERVADLKLDRDAWREASKRRWWHFWRVS